MLRLRLAILAVLVAAGISTGAVLLAGSADASGSAVSLVGKWKGALSSPGHHVSFKVTINRNQRTGTWYMSSKCYGTLKLKDISDGFHHYYRDEKQRGCAPAGFDCLKRAGSGMLDWFSGPDNIVAATGTLRRQS